jgi:hypothetical protein
MVNRMEGWDEIGILIIIPPHYKGANNGALGNSKLLI